MARVPTADHTLACDSTPHTSDDADKSGGNVLPVSIAEHLRCARECLDRGDRSVLDALIARVYKPVLAVLHRRLGHLPQPVDAAHDVLHDAILRIVAGLRTCHAGSDREVWGWVWTIVERARIDYTRSDGPRMLHLPSATAFDEVVSAASAGLPDDAEEPDPDDQALLRLVLAIYDQMPDDTAGLMYQRVVQDSTFAEIARSLGTTESGAKRRWQRAQRTLLRAVLRQLDALPRCSERDAVVRALATRRRVANRDS